MLAIRISEMVGLSGDCVGSFFVSLLAWKLSKNVWLTWKRKLTRFANNLKTNHQLYRQYTGGYGKALILWPYVFVFTCLYGARK